VSLAVCFPLKPADEKLVIAGIAFRETGKAGGMNSGSSSQSVHADSGIIGDCRESRLTGSIAGFCEAVFKECLKRLLSRYDAERSLSHHFNPERGEELIEFTNFPRIIRGQNQTLHPSISKWFQSFRP